MGKVRKKAITSAINEKKGKGNVKKAAWPSDLEYISFFNSCVIAKERLAEIDKIIDQRLLPNRNRYEKVSIGASSQISIRDGQPFNVVMPYCLNVSSEHQQCIPGLINNADQSSLRQYGLGIFDWWPGISQQPDIASIGINGSFSGGFRLTSGAGRVMPWYVIGVIHNMECSCNFKLHIHNGDPLSGYTFHDPAGHPKVGHPPPFTWEESAIDALVSIRHFNKVMHWNLPTILYTIEGYNGTAYKVRHRFTPYLWSYSNLFVKGKFVADHVFDPNAGSAQAGAAVVLKRMEERNLIHIPRW